MTSIDRKVESNTGESRLLPSVFVIEKGQPLTYKSVGPSALYIIEGSQLSVYILTLWIICRHLGEYQVEDQSTPGKVILLTTGDVALSDEGTIIKGSTPSKMKGEQFL